MIKTFKHIIYLCLLTSLLALSIVSCTQPTTPETKYKVSFDENRHGEKPTDIEVSPNTILSDDQLKSLTTEDDFTFVGWFDENGKQAIGGKYKVTKNVSLTAKWSSNYYTVTFDEKGHGTKPAVIKVVPNTELTGEQLKPLDNTDGLEFLGWYDGITEAKEGFKVTKDVTLTALWIDIAPAEVSDLKAITGDKKITLSWTKPQDIDFAKVIISYGDKTLELTNGETSTVITGLDNGTEYNYKIQTADKNNYVSKGIEVSQYPMYPLTETPNKIGTKDIEIQTQGNPETITKPFDIVQFGDYPQTVKTDDVKLSEKTTTVNNWTCYYGSDGYYYIKHQALSHEGGNSAKFPSSGNPIEIGKDYYFKLEPIEWRVLTTDEETYDGKKLLFSEKTLDYSVYESSTSNRKVGSEDIFPNNYEYSEIRAFLNGYDYITQDNTSSNMYKDKGFINKAFTSNAIKKIMDTKVENNYETTIPSDYQQSDTFPYSPNTNDKIFLLSVNELTRTNYGFGASSNRYISGTDYAFAKGIYYHAFPGIPQYNSHFWTRSPMTFKNFSNQAFLVDYEGVFAYRDTNNNICGIAPALCISK